MTTEAKKYSFYNPHTLSLISERDFLHQRKRGLIKKLHITRFRFEKQEKEILQKSLFSLSKKQLKNFEYFDHTFLDPQLPRVISYMSRLIGLRRLSVIIVYILNNSCLKKLSKSLSKLSTLNELNLSLTNCVKLPNTFGNISNALKHLIHLTYLSIVLISIRIGWKTCGWIMAIIQSSPFLTHTKSSPDRFRSSHHWRKSS